MTFVDVKNKKGTPLVLGVNPRGISVYRAGKTDVSFLRYFSSFSSFRFPLFLFFLVLFLPFLLLLLVLIFVLLIHLFFLFFCQRVTADQCESKTFTRVC